jgi:hypothetical protein
LCASPPPNTHIQLQLPVDDCLETGVPNSLESSESCKTNKEDVPRISCCGNIKSTPQQMKSHMRNPTIWTSTPP